MEPSVLHRQVPAFEEQDNCLYLLLGLARVTIHLRQLAEKQAALRNSTSADQPLVTSGTADEGEAVVFFILGLLSFANHYQQALDFYQAGYQESKASNQPTNGHKPPRLAIREFLR